MHLIFRLVLLSFLIFIFNPLFAGDTRLQENQLIFGNGGGFENLTLVTGQKYIQALNISNIPGDYFSKGINVNGTYYARLPLLKNTIFTVSDTIALNSNSNTSGLSNSYNVVVGDLRRAVIMLDNDTIDHRSATTADDVNYVFASSRLLVQAHGEATMLGRSNTASKPALNIFNTAGDVKVGIGTEQPGTMLTIDGNFKVTNGTVAGEIGVFQTANANDLSATTRVNSNSNSTYFEVSQKEFSVGFVDHTVLIFGSVSLSSKIGSIGKMRLRLKENDGGGIFSYETSGIDTDIKNSSVVEFDSSAAQEHFTLSTSWSGVIPPGASITEYRAIIEITGSDINNKALGSTHTTGTNGVESDMGVDLVVLGLPNASLAGAIGGPITDPAPSLEPVFSPTAPESGNYFTTNKVVFQHGSRIQDGANGLIMAEGNKYTRFRATKMRAIEHHDQDILEVIIPGTDDVGLLKIGAHPGNKLLFSPKATRHTWVDLNIETEAATLNIPSTVDFSAGALIVSDNVGISGEPLTDYSLVVNGHLGFTGNYQGQYGIVQRATLATDIGGGTQTILTTNLNLTGYTTAFDVIIFVNAGVETQGWTNMWVNFNGIDSEKYHFDGDNYANGEFSFSFIHSVNNVASGATYPIQLKWTGGEDIDAAASPNDYGASLDIIAVPRFGGTP